MRRFLKQKIRLESFDTNLKIAQEDFLDHVHRGAIPQSPFFVWWYVYHSQSWVVKMALFYPHECDLHDLGYPTLRNRTTSIDMSKKRWAQCQCPMFAETPGLWVSTRSYLVGMESEPYLKPSIHCLHCQHGTSILSKSTCCR